MLNNLSGFSFINPKKRRTFQELTGTFSVPEISFASATASSVLANITNYNAALTYSVSASTGSASRIDGQVTISGLSANQSTTITVSATGSQGIELSSSASFPSLPATPTLSRSGGTTTTVTVVIGNYDAGLTYTIGSTEGSATRSGDTISVTGLTAGQATTVTATASNSSGNSAQGSLATAAVPDTPTISFASATTNSLTFTITNYNAAYSYSVSASAGSASRSGDTITVTGLAEATTYTVFATATANGISSEQGSTTGTTTALPSGGIITESGGYRIHTFKSSGTFVNTETKNIEYLVVAGGGGGGTNGGGRDGPGGGGGLLQSTTSLPSGSYPISIGGAGSYGGPASLSTPGGPTSTPFATTTGGGGGGIESFGAGGQPGGSGGGGSGPGAFGNNTAGGSGIPGQGFPGGNGAGGPTPMGYRRGGGGGGAGGAGGNSAQNVSGAPGPGVTSSISGTAVQYAGGGAPLGDTAVQRPPNTGYGGSNTYWPAGSGVVVIRYLI